MLPELDRHDRHDRHAIGVNEAPVSQQYYFNAFL